MPVWRTSVCITLFKCVTSCYQSWETNCWRFLSPCSLFPPKSVQTICISYQKYRESILLREEQSYRRKSQHPAAHRRLIAELSEASTECEKLLVQMTSKSACWDWGVRTAQTRRGPSRVSSRLNKSDHWKWAVLTRFQGFKPALTRICQPQVDCPQVRWVFWYWCNFLLPSSIVGIQDMAQLSQAQSDFSESFRLVHKTWSDWYKEG